MKREKFERVAKKVETKIENKILAIRVFDEPRPNYVSKITLTDKLFRATILKLFPHSVRPNFVTVFRFVTIPFIVFFLLTGANLAAFWLFVISAFSDAIDGALARTRHQITDWGIVFDPLADKLLISSVAVIVITKLINPLLAGIIIAIELFLIVSAYYRFKGKLVPAKLVGKIKMILQSVGVAILLLSLVFPIVWLVNVATVVLLVAVIFAIMSLSIYRSI